MKIIEWVKENKLSTGLIVVLVIVLGYRSNVASLNSSKDYSRSYMSESSMMAPAADMDYSAAGEARDEIQVSSTERMVTKDTNLSLQVKKVGEVVGKIETIANENGGFMVSTRLTVPEGAASGNITIRVPTEKRQSVLDQVKGLAVKTVSESVNGRDITDQYTDVQSRLAILNRTKVKYEDLMERYGTISDLLNVQRELLNLQQQIDSLKGREKYLKDSAELTKITIYLSTDELALPYSPDQPWRPAVIAKTAIRSLVGNIRKVGTAVIWMGVYSPAILVGYLVYRVIKKKRKLP